MHVGGGTAPSRAAAARSPLVSRRSRGTTHTCPLVPLSPRVGRSFVYLAPSAPRTVECGARFRIPRIKQMHVYGLDHVQLAMPRGAEEQARAFYAGVLGLDEVPKPPNLAARGGVWFSGGGLHLHLGVEGDFHPARKAHPALLVRGLARLAARC